MFDFRMAIKENFASFRDSETGKVVYVDSFDNREFNVRFGTVYATDEIGSVIAEDDATLNARLRELVLRFVENPGEEVPWK